MVVLDTAVVVYGRNANRLPDERQLVNSLMEIARDAFKGPHRCLSLFRTRAHGLTEMSSGQPVSPIG